MAGAFEELCGWLIPSLLIGAATGLTVAAFGYRRCYTRGLPAKECR